MQDERTNAIRKFHKREVAGKAFQIFGVSVSVTTVALHLSIFQPTCLASHPAKQERRLAFRFLS